MLASVERSSRGSRWWSDVVLGSDEAPVDTNSDRTVLRDSGGILAGLSGALLCSPVLDDRNGRPASQVFDHVITNGIRQLQIEPTGQDSRLPPPARPYKAPGQGC